MGVDFTMLFCPKINLLFSFILHGHLEFLSCMKTHSTTQLAKCNLTLSGDSQRLVIVGLKQVSWPLKAPVACNVRMSVSLCFQGCDEDKGKESI